MRRIYTFLLYLIAPLIVLRLYYKGRRLPAYRARIGERFSVGVKGLSPTDVWLHGVSLGEMVAATPLIEALLARGERVLITTMTPTGSQYVSKQFAGRVQHQYLPYDLPWCLRRFFSQIHARVGIIMETEIWPNMIHMAKQHHIPLMIVNARLSDRAYQRYQQVRFIFKPILNELTAILAQSDQDAQRFIALGAASDKVSIMGNMKFDMEFNVSVKPELISLSEKWGPERTVLIAASTHDDEEKQLLTRLKRLQVAIPGLLLLIAPRHPERFDDVYLLSQSLGFKTGRRTQLSSIQPDHEVIILDSLGELLQAYQLSDYAFVGGSLVPIGGHNVLEPLGVQVPVLCGPYMNNSQSICDELCRAGALTKANDADDLVGAIIHLNTDPKSQALQIKNATAILNTHRGAVLRCMKIIEGILERV